MTQTTTTVKFEITHNISSSKGWGRYKASTAAGRLIQSSTGNDWVSAPHSGMVEDGAAITVTLQTMKRAGKAKRETVNTTDYRLIAQSDATATLGFWDGLEVVVSGARLAEVVNAQ